MTRAYLIQITETIVIIIEPINIIALILRFGSKAPLSCLLKPNKKPEPAIDKIFPSVKDIAYLKGLPMNSPSIEPRDIISIKMPSPKQTAKAISRSLNVREGKQESSSSS